VRALVIGGVIVLGIVLVAGIPLARRGPAAAAAGYAVATLVWLTLVWRARLRSLVLTRSGLLVMAVILRSPFFFFDPVLSDDIHRYRWDGVVSAAGINPYEHAPASAELDHLPGELRYAVNHPGIPTIYPPLAQALFWLWGSTGVDLWLWRLVILAADLAIVGLAGRSLGLMWASCPLVIFEGVWSGHLEILVTAALLASWAAMERRRENTASILAAVAAGLKLTPIAAFPALVAASGNRMRVIGLLLIGLALPFVPFAGGPIMGGLNDYATRWEFNGPVYETLKWCVEVSGAHHGLKSAFTLVKDVLGLEPVSGWVYARLYPAWLARALCAVPFALLLVFAMRRDSLAGRMAWGTASLLIVSPTVHPWYWLPVFALAVPARERLLVALALASPLSYVWYVDAAASKFVSLLLSYGIPVAAFMTHAGGRGYSSR
jgi:hypothetical protein